MSAAMSFNRGGKPRYHGGPEYLERHKVSFYLSGRTASQARAICEKTGMDYAELGRIALLDYMNRLAIAGGAE